MSADEEDIMDGITLARIVTEELEKQGISKGEFYAQAGITATAFYGCSWCFRSPL